MRPMQSEVPPEAPHCQHRRFGRGLVDVKGCVLFDSQTISSDDHYTRFHHRAIVLVNLIRQNVRFKSEYFSNPAIDNLTDYVHMDSILRTNLSWSTDFSSFRNNYVELYIFSVKYFHVTAKTIHICFNLRVLQKMASRIYDELYIIGSPNS